MTGRRIKMNPETTEKIKVWFHNCIDRRPFKSLSHVNQYNSSNLLAGFLQACEEFGHIDHDEAAILFKELTE
jgi:hypothetical protein